MQPEEFARVRKMMGLTQQALALNLGVSRVLVNQMEAGKAPIERRTMLAMLYLFEHPENRAS